MAILPHILLLSLLILTPIATGLTYERPLVNTKYGKLRGVTLPVKETSRVVDGFYGVPFAQPPVGPLRFAKPVPPEPWYSVRDASRPPPMCLQIELPTGNPSLQMPPISEDCLYMNVYTPADRDQKTKLPVMFFIHGGAMVIGTASTYEGSALCAYENVVVVSTNYRLGIPGFFSTGDKKFPGNYAFLDQVAALQWVQENIADFGGDPGCVTIFGESAGAMSVTAVMLSPLAKGLFHRAIAESGTVIHAGFIASSPEELVPYQELVANISGCDLASLADCLKKKSEKEFLAITQTMGVTAFPGSVHGVFLPKPVKEMMANKEGNKVPFLIGINNQEFGWALPQLLNITGITEGMTRETMIQKVQEAIPVLSPDVIPFVVDEYLGDITDPLKIRDRFLDLCGDQKFVIPALQIAKYYRDLGLPVYFYEFQHPPSSLARGRPSFVKCDHGDEILFVFGGPFLRDGAFFAGPATPEEEVLTREVIKYWTNFARTGKPNSPDLTTWRQYGTEEHYMEMNLKLKLSSKLKEREYKFWTEILPEKIQKAVGVDRTEL
ncbi:fatty acyl-CoA hydrolase precursor, medium chain-like isoform X2 [Bufo bufo]|uniref:fatty acyl-CoA hydrolase precursor, medium chain-like isoform X2 n=1 Tax=Bufo bufo TaxID=8384 RepID=UPI001ABE18B4|nr:fatty acyl-CoA hydrolase precursor, medium chain-like isoform X2 [Bufo bufo]